MSKKLFVGGLAWATKDEGLYNAFSRFGKILEAKVICERDTGRSRGFGFVTFENDLDAAEAEDKMQGALIDGRTIRIDSSERNDKKSHRRFSQNNRSDSDDSRRSNHTPHDSHAYTSHSDEGAYRDDRDRRQSRPRRDFSDADYGFVQNMPGKQGRDTRKKDRKNERDMREDDERW